MARQFVGRLAELAALHETIKRSVRDQRPAVTVMIGIPGSGKSRLLREASSRISAPCLLRVVGYEPEQAVPLAAARDALRKLTESGSEGTQLGAIAFGVDASEATPDALRLFEAAHRCVRRSGQAVVIVDDLQWVDDLSSALISYLLRAAETARLPFALVAAGRPSANVGALRGSVGQILGDADRLVEVELGALPREAGVAMVRSLAPDASVTDAVRIWSAAAGSPFWIEALSTGRDGVDASIGNRLLQLSSDAASVLQVMAVVGRPTDARELADLLTWLSDRVERGASELQNRGLATDTAGLFQVAHDLIREAAVAGLPAELLRQLHARIATYLRGTANGDLTRLREALDHARRAGLPAIELAIELAGATQRRLLGSDGVRQLVEVAEQVDRSDPRRQELELRLANLAGELGDRLLELERWTTVADRRHDDAVRARALIRASKAAHQLGRREEAAHFVDEARAIGLEDEALEIALDAQESEILRWLDHRIEEARALTTRAVTRARTLIQQVGERGHLSPPLRSACADALQAAYDLALQDDDAVAMADIAEELVTVADGELARLRAQLTLAFAYRGTGSMAHAEQTARAVWQAARRRLYPALMVEAGNRLAQVLYETGKLEEAERVALETEEVSQRVGDTSRSPSSIRSQRHAIATGRGNWQQALADLRREAEGESDPHFRLGLHQEIAVWLSRLAGAEAEQEIRQRLAAADADVATAGCPRCRQELALRTAEAFARIGDPTGATQALATHVGERTRHSREARPYLVHAAALIAMARGRHTRAAGLLTRLSARLTRDGLYREVLWVDLDLANAWMPRDRDRAVTLYRSVAERAAAGGAITDLQVAQQRLRQLGARPTRRPAATGPLGLSRRELEVAQMAVAGASNPEIAQTLFLSRKTVERHMSNALRKAGVRRRTHLAARLATATDQGAKTP